MFRIRVHNFVSASICLWGLVMILLGLLIGLSQPVMAHTPTTAAVSTKGEKLMGAVEQKRIVQNLVKQLVNEPFLNEAELPYRIALSTIALRGDVPTTTSHRLTDAILNALIDQHGVLIVNQDFSTDLDADYRLMDYLMDFETRKKGTLLGADYYISGFLKCSFEENSQGHRQVVYTAELWLREIRTSAAVAHSVLNGKL